MLIMGLFTLFTGFVYNDFFSKAMTLTTSYWINIFTRIEMKTNPFLTLDPAAPSNPVYYLGVDPVWAVRFLRYVRLHFHLTCAR